MKIINFELSLTKLIHSSKQKMNRPKVRNQFIIKNPWDKVSNEKITNKNSLIDIYAYYYYWFKWNIIILNLEITI